MRGNKGLKSTRQRRNNRKMCEQLSSHFKPITAKDFSVPKNASRARHALSLTKLPSLVWKDVMTF